MLCLVSEGPTYGLTLAGQLAPDGSLGRIWSVPKAMVYYTLQQLELLGLIRMTGAAGQPGPSSLGLRITPAAGRVERVAVRWRTSGTGFERTLVLWRHEAMTATVQFLTVWQRAESAAGPCSAEGGQAHQVYAGPVVNLDEDHQHAVA